MPKGRIFSGMRPTGRLHLGNYLGALENWVQLQDEYECYYGIVDLHALTTDYEDTSRIRENVRQLAIDFLSAGLDPEKSVILVQSHVKEHAELHLLLSMITPLGWLERVPTYKEQLRQLEGRDLTNYGFLGYPVLQAADISLYKADTVPVGEDQLPHLELCREIVRRFNHLYGEVLLEPQAKLNKVQLLPGVDGRKMSKSYGNEIPLGAEPEEVRARILSMITDPQRQRRNDPGRPEVCVAYTYHGIFNEPETQEISTECRRAGIGCVDCKKRLAERVIEATQLVREKRRQLEAHPELVDEILFEGARKARKVAQETLEEVREAMKIS